MNKNIVIIIIFLLSATLVYSDYYHSEFGFSIDIPSHWLIISQKELQDNSDLLDLNNPKMANINKDLLDEFMVAVQSGRVEVYLNLETNDNTFIDNINCMKQFGQIPNKQEEIDELKSLLPAQFSEYFGRNVGLYVCELKEVNEFKALHLEFDGAIEGTSNIQYMIQKSNSVMLMITATFKNSNGDKIKKEFEKIIQSIK